MAEPADKLATLAALRWRPANSNDAARAVFSHHFVNVPRCSYARDDGISAYLAAQTGIEQFPASPEDAQSAGSTAQTEAPPITTDTASGTAGIPRKLLRGGFGLSVALHIGAALALGYVALTVPAEPTLEEGTLSVTFVAEGSIETTAAGAEKEVEAPDVTEPEVTEKPIEKPVEKPPEEIEKPLEAKKEESEPRPEPIVPQSKAEPKAMETPVEAPTQTTPSDVPLPGADLPQSLTSKTESKTEIAAAASASAEEKLPEPDQRPDPIVAEAPIEPTEPVTETAARSLPHPVSKPIVVKKVVEPKPQETAEKPVEVKKEDPKLRDKPIEKPIEKPKKERPKKKKQVVGNRGEAASSSDAGDVDADKKGRSSKNSRGDSVNTDIGNAARSNYKGLVNRKLVRAKGRVRLPGKGSVTVSFTILADGSISGLRVKRSSGKPAVDTAAMKAVRLAAPFPPIPTELGQKSWPFSVEVSSK